MTESDSWKGDSNACPGCWSQGKICQDKSPVGTEKVDKKPRGWRERGRRRGRKEARIVGIGSCGSQEHSQRGGTPVL